MTRRRRIGRRAVLSAAAAVLAASPAAVTEAAPNPYGDRATRTTIVLHPDGSYDVTLRQSVELVREFQVGFGGGVHDGFRLPNDGGLLPPYLRATYALTGVTVAPGQPVPADFTRTNHLVAVRSVGTYPAGTHQAEIRYRVTAGAARPTADGWLVHVRLLDIGYARGDRLEIDASETRPTGLSLRCVAIAPDAEPCGTTGGTTLIDVFDADLDQTLPPEYLIEVTAPNRAVSEPEIDRR